MRDSGLEVELRDELLVMDLWASVSFGFNVVANKIGADIFGRLCLDSAVRVLGT